MEEGTQTAQKKTFSKMKCPVRCRFYTGLFLGLFGVVSIVLIATVYITKTKYDEINNAKNEIIALQEDLSNAEKLMNKRALQIPLLATSFLSLSSQPKIVSIDRETGAESELALDWQGSSSLVAVPQVGYDGRVYVSLIQDEVNFISEVSAVNLKTGKITKTSLRSQSGILSPDQRYAVVFNSDISDNHYNDYLDNQILVYNFNNDEFTVIGELKNDESLTELQSDSSKPFQKVSINWENNLCILVDVYQITDSENNNTINTFKEKREMCLN